MSIVIDTPEGIAAFRLLALRSALKIEVNTGMKMSRGISPLKIAKAEFGFKGSKASVLKQLEDYLYEAGILQPS